MSDHRHGWIGAAFDGRDSHAAPHLGAFAGGPFEQCFLHRGMEEGEYGCPLRSGRKQIARRHR